MGAFDDVPWKCKKSRIWGNSEAQNLWQTRWELWRLFPWTLGLGEEWLGEGGSWLQEKEMSDILGKQASQRQATWAGASVRAEILVGGEVN